MLDYLVVSSKLKKRKNRIKYPLDINYFLFLVKP